MANVQLENGYTQLANELLGALIVFRFTGAQHSMLDLIIRLSYGCGKTTATFQLWSDFEVAGVLRQNVKPNLESLETAKILAIDWNSKTMQINKDYNTWTIPYRNFHQEKRLSQLIKMNLDCNVQITNVMHRLQRNAQITNNLSLGDYKCNAQITHCNVEITSAPSKPNDSNTLEHLKKSKENKEESSSARAHARSNEFATLNKEEEFFPNKGEENLLEYVKDELKRLWPRYQIHEGTAKYEDVVIIADYTREAIDEAVGAAAAAEVRAGNATWIINRLRHPERYVAATAETSTVPGNSKWAEIGCGINDAYGNDGEWVPYRGIDDNMTIIAIMASGVKPSEIYKFAKELKSQGVAAPDVMSRIEQEFARVGTDIGTLSRL